MALLSQPLCLLWFCWHSHALTEYFLRSSQASHLILSSHELKCYFMALNMKNQAEQGEKKPSLPTAVELGR